VDLMTYYGDVTNALPLLAARRGPLDRVNIGLRRSLSEAALNACNEIATVAGANDAVVTPAAW